MTMTMTRRTMTLGLLGSGIAMSCRAAPSVQIQGGWAFGSSWRITTGPHSDLEQLRPSIEDIIERVDAQMSPYRGGSNLSVFNAARSATWHPMPHALCYVATSAQLIAQRTNGAFDPTVGPLVSRLGFGPITGAAGRFSDIEVDLPAGALRKATANVTLDLCGIAKGYALDQIIHALEGAGVADALIELGGELRALGLHPQGRPWRVAISDPSADGFRAHQIVTLDGLALATSGHAANGLTGRHTTSHIINPHLGRAANTALRSVSVLAPTAMEADALATALCSAGPDRGVAMARKLECSALFVTETQDVMTGRFANHVLI